MIPAKFIKVHTLSYPDQYSKFKDDYPDLLIISVMPGYSHNLVVTYIPTELVDEYISWKQSINAVYGKDII